MAFAHNPKIVTDGLVLYLDAANSKSYPGSGTTWKDLSKNGNDNILTNGPTFSSDNQGGFSFDGSNDYAERDFFFLDTDPIVTINGWCRRTGTQSNAGWWGLGGGVVSRGINNYSSSTRANKIGWDLWGRTTFDTGENYPLNEWVNVCWVKNATSFSTSTCFIYINGVNAPIVHTQRNNSSSVNLKDGIALGKISVNSGSYLAPFDISSFSIYNRALSESEIKQNFAATRGRYGI